MKKLLVLIIFAIMILSVLVGCAWKKDSLSVNDDEEIITADGYVGTWEFSHVWDSEQECETRPLMTLLYDTITIYPDGTGTGINVYDNGKSDRDDFNWEIEAQSDGLVILKVGINSGVFYNKNICYLVEEDAVSVYHGSPTEFAYYLRSSY